MKPTLYLLCGAPGSGKTTWAMKHFLDSYYVSRDDIRFSIVKENEPYFSHEEEVFKKFVAILSQTLVDELDVMADATHLNPASRRKLLRALRATNVEFNIICVCFLTSLETCKKRNALRTGRHRVPDNNLEDMYYHISWPTGTEDESIKQIWFVRENDNE